MTDTPPRRAGASAEEVAGKAGGRLDPRETTVHDAVRGVPGATEVFRRFGIDACCGGELSLATAAERHGVELRRLLDALERSTTPEARDDAER